MSRQMGYHDSTIRQDLVNGEMNYHGIEQGLDASDGVRLRHTLPSTVRPRMTGTVRDSEGQRLTRRSTHNPTAEKEKNQKYQTFMKEHFSYRECTYFKPKKVEEPIQDTSQCHCGGLKSEHPPDTIYFKPGEVEADWSQDCLKYFTPINAYGKIEFVSANTESNQSNPTAEYVRISDKSATAVKRQDGSYIKSVSDAPDVKHVLLSVLQLMYEYWGLMNPRLPSLCISVIGGAKNYKMAPKQQDVFNQGLVKAAQTTGAWIITSGLNLGITKVVGEAIAEGKSQAHSQRLTCIGIAPWGYVLNNDDLINKTHMDGAFQLPSAVKKYKVSEEVKTGQPVSLNQHHTHYILVDDGKRRSYGGSYSGKFRALLEREISFPTKGNIYVGQGIPVVLIIVEGGHDVFLDASESIESLVPVVICKNTGRAADILAFAYKNAQPLARNESRVVETYNQRLDKMYAEERSADEAKKKKEKAKELIGRILQNKKLVTVFDIKKRKAEDFDFAILNALIQKEETDGSSYQKQIQLALTWNRVDVAEKIFRGARGIKPEHLDLWMNKALEDDQLDFVQLFLQNGVVMENFLTRQRLVDLYNPVTKSDALTMALNYYFGTQRYLIDGKLSLFTIRKLIRKLVGAYRNPIYEQIVEVKTNALESGKDPGSLTFQRPFTELFLWAVLFCRHEMAKFMWERTEESIHLAIVATRIYQSMQKTLATYDTETQERYKSYKEEFENLAAGVLEECNVINPTAAVKLVDKEYAMWGEMSTLELAARASDKKFLSSVVSQNSLDSCWTKGLTAHYLVILICIFNPWLIYFKSIIKFKQPQEESKEHLVLEQLSYGSKLQRFYSAPKTKFVITVVSYLFFVAFYSYFILFEMLIDRITPVEIVVFIYFGSIFMEGMREIFVSKAETAVEKLYVWFRFSEWHILDLILIPLALVAALMRISVSDLFMASRTIYCIVGILVFIRILRLYSASEYLGPKLVMIFRMLRELLIFILIIGVALFCFGVTTQALLYPSRAFSREILLEVVYNPYWEMMGEIYLDAANAKVDNCVQTFAFDSNTFQGSGNTTMCPQYHFLVPLFLAVYTMIGNVLLLNLLIAIFTNIFQEVQENSIEIWKFKMFTLVMEFKHKAYLPIPFNLIEEMVRLCVYVVRFCSKLRTRDVKPIGMDESQMDEADAKLLFFESDSRSIFLKERSRINRGRLENQVATISLKVDTLGQNLDELHKQIQNEVSFHHPQIEPPPVRRHESHLSGGSADNNVSPRTSNDLNTLTETGMPMELKGNFDRLNNLEERMSHVDSEHTGSLNIVAPSGLSTSQETEQLKRLDARLTQMEKSTAEALYNIEKFLRKMLIKKAVKQGVPTQEGSSSHHHHPPPRRN